MQTSKQSSTQNPAPHIRSSLSTPLIRGAIIALLFVFLFALLPSCFQLVTLVTYTVRPAPAPTISANTAVLDKANDVLARADQESTQTQNLLNQMNAFATVLSLVLALFAVVTVGLGVFGFSTNTGFRDLETQWREHLDDLVTLQNETQSKGTEINRLQEEMRQKQQDIDRLQEETRQKQQNIDELQQRLQTLKETMEREVASVEQRFETMSTALTFLILGNQLLEQRERQQAIEAYERAQKLRPNDPQINYALGKAYSGAGSYDNAISCLTTAVTVSPDFAQAQMELGLAYRRRGNMLSEEAKQHTGEHEKIVDLQERATADYKKAIEHLTRAVTLRRDYEDALGALGGLYRRLEDYERALEYYEQAAQADPNSSYALGNVASLAWYLGKKDLALATFARTKEIAKERIAKLVSPEKLYWDYYDLALAQLALGETEDAKTTYSAAIERTPGPVELEGVLSNLSLLQRVNLAREQADQIPDLDKVIEMVEPTKSALRAR